MTDAEVIAAAANLALDVRAQVATKARPWCAELWSNGTRVARCCPGDPVHSGGVVKKGIRHGGTFWFEWHTTPAEAWACAARRWPGLADVLGPPQRALNLGVPS